MKEKVVLKAVFIAYLITGACLLLLAFFLFRFDLGEKEAEAGIVITYILACSGGGFVAGKSIRKKKYIWGIITGIAYFILLLAVSVLVRGKWDMRVTHALTAFFMCTGGGALGGLFS